MSPTVYPCRNCGQPYQLDADYLARYGGHTTTCGGASYRCCCRHWPDWLIGAGRSRRKGLSAAPPAGGVLAYQRPTPGGSQVGGPVGAFADRHLVVAADRAEFPPACVKCGRPGGRTAGPSTGTTRPSTCRSWPGS